MKKIINSLVGKIIIGTVLSLIVITSIYYIFFNGTVDPEKYDVLTTIAKGDLVTSISASGQVSSAEEIDLQSKTSGTVDGVYVAEGDYVEAGQLILSIDATDALTSVTAAEISVEQAELDLEELGEPADESDIKRAQNDITNAQNDLTDLTDTYNSDYADKLEEIADLQADIPDTYATAFNAASEIFVALPDILDDVEGIVEGNNMATNQRDLNYYSDATGNDLAVVLKKDEVQDAYYQAESSYNKALDIYEDVSREDIDQIQSLADATYTAVYDLSEVLKDLNVYLALVYDKLGASSYCAGTIQSQRSTVSSSTSAVNPYLSSIYDEIEAIDDLYDSIDDANADLEELTKDYASNQTDLELTAEEKQLDLDDLQSSDVSALDIRAQELIVEQKENALASAQKNYDNYFVYATIPGQISTLDISEGETLSSSTVFGTLIDDSKQIVVSLNEVDILDIEVGQTATVTFDAIPDFEAEAVVVERASSGTVNQGVVSYDVTLSIQSDDERILSGMSADLEIVLMSKTDVLVVPMTAVKTDPQGSYVEMVTDVDSLPPSPFYSPSDLNIEKTYLELGEQDDTNYEIVSGIDEGATIVLMTTSVETDTEEDAASSLQFGSPQGGGNFTPPSGGMPSGGAMP